MYVVSGLLWLSAVAATAAQTDLQPLIEQVLDEPIELTVENAPLADFFSQVSDKTGVSILMRGVSRRGRQSRHEAGKAEQKKRTVDVHCALTLGPGQAAPPEPIGAVSRLVFIIPRICSSVLDMCQVREVRNMSAEV